MCRDFILCLSLANLLFVTAWFELQSSYGAALAYFSKEPANNTLFLAIVAQILSTTLIFWIGISCARRSKRLWSIRIAQCAFLGLLALAFEMFRIYHWGFLSVPNQALLYLEILMLAGCVLLLFTRSQTILKFGITFVAIMAPLFPISLIHLVLQSPKPSDLVEERPAPKTGPPASRRVAWLIFDEMDQGLLFEQRPDSVELPDIDRLRLESLYATQALPAASMTLEAIPSLISGRLVASTNALGPARLDLIIPEGTRSENWLMETSIFAKARAMGFRTGVTGWYHPYGRLFGKYLDQIFWLPSRDATPFLRRREYARHSGLARTMVQQAHRRLNSVLHEWMPLRFRIYSDDRHELQVLRRQNLEDFLQLRERSILMLADERLDFVMIHLSIPHPLGIYSRRKNQFSLSESANYVDNLELVNRTIAEIRAAMEKAGIWDRTALLVTSDHPFRPPVWNYRPTWTKEMAAIEKNGQFDRVPFILKMAGPGLQMEYEAPFNTVLIHDLTLALLQGTLSDGRSVVSWLDKNRARPAAGVADRVRRRHRVGLQSRRASG